MSLGADVDARHVWEKHWWLARHGELPSELVSHDV